MNQQPMKTAAIKAFLEARTLPDLAALYNPGQEVQVTVAKDEGDRVEGEYKGKEWQGYSDGLTTWKPIRIPMKAMSEPEYTDSPIGFDLAEHALGIGLTGWHWVERRSVYVAFDFDAIVDHAASHRKKMSDEELQEIGSRVAQVPWVQLRRSTGGRGRHIYVFLEPVETRNHTEHAAVARAVLAQLSGLCGFDFSAKVDTCGGNIWIWHRKMVGTDGLALLKEHTEKAIAPENWRDYLKVVSGSRQRSVPGPIEEQKETHSDIEDTFSRLTGQRTWSRLDPEHLKLFNWLRDRYPHATWWDADHHMLVTHTALLKEAHTELGMRGHFETSAKGTERGSDINCFCFAIARGAWAIRRYTLGVAEDACWEQDGQGWTKCVFNREPDLAGAARLHGGVEDPAGGWVFPDAESAQKVALLLGADLKLPQDYLTTPAKLKPHKSGRLSVELDRLIKPAVPQSHFHAGSPATPLPAPEGWLPKGKKLVRLFAVKADAPTERTESVRLDDQVRHLITPDGSDYGWSVRSDDSWHLEPFHHVKEVLRSLGFDAGTTTGIIGASILEPWTIVNRPFEPEFPGNRQWNRDAAQLRFQPSATDQGSRNYPSWLKILAHCGRGLDEAVAADLDWCKPNGVLTGADYLKVWIASLFQRPLAPLPYLFFFGEQNTGKSVFHEAISLLITRGVMRADTALTSKENFNGELENAVLCVVEETNLQKNLQAYNRIKDWVTARELLIHRKHKQPYLIPNTAHFVQCANSLTFCPVFMGDTRITMVEVPKLPEGAHIPKDRLLESLRGEAPDFLAEILSLEIPEVNDRLGVPVIVTDAKRNAERDSLSMLEMFLEENCEAAPGLVIKFSEFYERFVSWLDPNLVSQWGKIKVSKEVALKYPKGRQPQTGQFYIGNIKWENDSTQPLPGVSYRVRGDKLILEEVR